MQGRDEYEADYYSGEPFRPGQMPQRPMTGGWMPPRENCCRNRINEILEELERAPEMQSDEVRRIVAEIRKVCGSIDGRGCMAIEYEPDREMMEMLLEQVMDRLDGMQAVETSTGRDGGRDWYRELVEMLIRQELMRRRMRRRMPSRRPRY